jgi:hypothetical protein
VTTRREDIPHRPASAARAFPWVANGQQPGEHLPRNAGRQGPTRAYEGDRIRMLWDTSRFIHVGSCVRASWTSSTAGPGPELIWTERRRGDCPGRAHLPDQGPALPGPERSHDEVPTSQSRLGSAPTGRSTCGAGSASPSRAGRWPPRSSGLPLCRCGASPNKPFCEQPAARSGHWVTVPVRRPSMG